MLHDIGYIKFYRIIMFHIFLQFLPKLQMEFCEIEKFNLIVKVMVF